MVTLSDRSQPEQPASPHHELATRFLARYGQFIEDLAMSDNFSVLASMPEFISYVQDTEHIFNEFRTEQARRSA